MTVETLKTQCNKHVGDLLESCNFAYSNGAVRPRGTIVEYRRNEESIILGWEEGELIVDLILKTSDTNWVRVSLNQLLWFDQSRTLATAETSEEKLRAVRAEFSVRWGEFLKKETVDLDPRYCFEMNREEHGIYMSAQYAGAS